LLSPALYVYGFLREKKKKKMMMMCELRQLKQSTFPLKRSDTLSKEKVPFVHIFESEEHKTDQNED